MKRIILILVAVSFATTAFAQDTSQTQVTPGAPTIQTQTLSGTVVYVSGNDLVIRLEDGQVKHYTAAPGTTAMVDGKEITMRDVVPGMSLTRTITTATTPKTVETIRTIKGNVWWVNPPRSVILSLPEGNKQYRVPEGQKFTINGQSGLTVWDLRKGMEVEATVIKTVPETVVTANKSISGEMPPPPPPPSTPEVQGVLLIEEVIEVAEVVPAPPLPQTGSSFPLLAFVGFALTGASLGLKLIRS